MSRQRQRLGVDERAPIRGADGRLRAEAVRSEPLNARTIAGARRHLDPGDVVLDYGCGTGTVAFEIADAAKKVHGIDVSSKMIDLAKRKTAPPTSLSCAKWRSRSPGITYPRLASG